MKVLSLTQPWATLVVIGAKRFETRSWKTAYRGEILIHAAKRFPLGCRILCEQDSLFVRSLAGWDTDKLPRGAMVGKARLVDCLPVEAMGLAYTTLFTKQEEAFGDYSPSRFAWKLDDAELFETPIPAKGSLGLWEFPESALGHLPERG